MSCQRHEGQTETALSGFRGAPPRPLGAERFSERRWGGGRHVTPNWVLHSHLGCCRGTTKKSATYKISGAAQRRTVPIRELVENKSEPRLKKKSAVGFLPVADGGNFDGAVSFQIEEDPVIAATETEAGKRRLQLFDIAGAAGEVAIHTVKNLHSRFAADRAEIGAGCSGGSVTSLRRTRAGFPRGGCLHRGRAKHGRAPAPRPFPE